MLSWYCLVTPGTLSELAEAFGPEANAYARLVLGMEDLQRLLAEDRGSLLGN